MKPRRWVECTLYRNLGLIKKQNWPRFYPTFSKSARLKTKGCHIFHKFQVIRCAPRWSTELVSVPRRFQ